MKKKRSTEYENALWRGLTGSEFPMPPGAFWCSACGVAVLHGVCPTCGMTQTEAARLAESVATR